MANSELTPRNIGLGIINLLVYVSNFITDMLRRAHIKPPKIWIYVGNSFLNFLLMVWSGMFHVDRVGRSTPPPGLRLA